MYVILKSVPPLSGFLSPPRQLILYTHQKKLLRIRRSRLFLRTSFMLDLGHRGLTVVRVKDIPILKIFGSSDTFGNPQGVTATEEYCTAWHSCERSML